MKRLVAAIIIALFFVVPAWAQLPGGSTIVGGSTPITGTCPTGYFLYNALGVVGCQAGGSGGSYLAGTGLTLTGSTFSLNTPTATTIGGVESITSLAHNWIGYIDTSGVPHQSQPAIADISGWGANVATALGSTLNGTGAITATDSPTFTTKETTPSLSLAGNISAPAWTTSGVRLVGVPATLTDTSSSGTVAAAYTDVLGGNTIAASSATTYTDYYSMFIKSPVAGANATFTRSWSLGLQGNLQAAGAALGGAALGANVLSVNGTVNIQGQLALQNGANAQSFLVYNTYSSGGTNYERGIFDWQANANVLTIGTQAGGTGVARNIEFVVGGVDKLDYGATGSGYWTFYATILAPLGSASAPGYSFGSGFGTTGFYGFSGGVVTTIMGTARAYTTAAGLGTTSGGVFGSEAGVTGTMDTGLSRLAAGTYAVGNGTAGNASGILKAAVLGTTTAYTVATLPTGFAGARTYVTDAVACTSQGALTGSGSTPCPVWYNGSAWVGD